MDKSIFIELTVHFLKEKGKANEFFLGGSRDEYEEDYNYFWVSTMIKDTPARDIYPTIESKT